MLPFAVLRISLPVLRQFVIPAQCIGLVLCAEVVRAVENSMLELRAGITPMTPSSNGHRRRARGRARACGVAVVSSSNGYSDGAHSRSDGGGSGLICARAGYESSKKE